MFKDIPLKSTYSSYEDDIAKIFYIPVLKCSKKYDRATAYFSAKALANYAMGMEEFARKGNQCRMIISTEISVEDYSQIKEGYKLKETLTSELISKLREEINLEEERNISNLAYLISIRIIEIKMAFTKRGIFHDKFGIMEDEEGNIICFRGSNNETFAALNLNYEGFDITCSWQASTFDYTKITKSQEVFDELWNNQVKNIKVCNMDEVIKKEILSFNKGEIICEKVQLEENCILLDWDNELRLDIKIDPDFIKKNKVYKLKLRRYVDLKRSTDIIYRFKAKYGYIDFKKIINILEKDSVERKYRFLVTKRLRNYINKRELYIEKRANIGKSIKNKEEIVVKEFEKYKQVVNDAFERPLREQQMWDSFFMCMMKRSNNFSVPGSGKTASVLGVYAYLNSKGLVKRIIMIGPKNSFDSWVDEFRACFGNKHKLSLFNIHDTNYNSADGKRRAILFETGNSNLALFNYESLETYINQLKELITPETLLVFDEVHKIKAINGVRANNSLKISKNANYIIALTGTPIPNSYLDIKNLLNILYHDEYNEFFGFSISDLKNPNSYKKECINQKLKPFFCRTSKQQLNVPNANPDIISDVYATEEENRLFQILLLKYKSNKLALIIRLLQMESNPKMLLKALDISEFEDILDTSLETSKIDFIDFSEDVKMLIENIKSTQKIKACVDLASKLYNENKTVIIWCIFIDSMNNIKYRLQKKGITVECINGSVDIEERKRILDSFKLGKIDILITNPHTLAESVSLHKMCHDAIYFEYSYNLVHLLQSKDRIHRLGLSEGQYTQYYYLQEHFITSDGINYSLDEKIYNRLLEKEQTMLDAIENDILESGTTVEDDVEFIFKELGL